MSDRHAETSLESTAGLEVPEEIRRSTAGTGSSLGCVVIGIALVFPVALYFGFFGLLLIDALILETNWFSPENVPEQAIDAVRIVYAPLIFLVNWWMNG